MFNFLETYYENFSCYCSGRVDSAPPFEDCERCFLWQHAKKDLKKRRCEHYLLSTFLQSTFPRLYQSYCVKKTLPDKKCVYNGPPVRKGRRKNKCCFQLF